MIIYLLKILFIICSILFFLFNTDSKTLLESFIRYCLLIFVISFILLLLGMFTLFNLTLFFIASVLTILISKRKNIKEILFKKLHFQFEYIPVLFLILLYIALLFPKISEWYVSGMDAGNYINIAHTFVNTSSFANSFEFDKAKFDCISGFYCVEGVITPAYLHVYPILLSVGILLDKAWGIIAVQLTLSGLALLSFYELVKEFLNRKIATISLIILGLIPLQILYAKESMSEITAQIFLFSMCLFAYKWWKSKEKFSITSAVIALSMLLLTKLDSILVLMPVLFFGLSAFLIDQVKLKKIRYTFWPLLGVAGYYYFFATNYTSKSYFGTLDFPLSALLILFVPILFFLLSFVKIKSRFKNKAKNLLLKNLRWIMLIVYIIVISLLLYQGAKHSVNCDKENFNRVNLLRLVYFTTPLVGITSFLGLLIFTAKDELNKIALIFSFVLVGFITLWRSMHSSPLYWWGRRYLLFAIPLIAIFAGYFVYKLLSLRNCRFRVTSCVFVIIFSVILFNNSKPAFEYHQNAGINSQIVNYAERLPDDSIILAKKHWQHNLVGSSITSIFNKKWVLYKGELNENDLLSLIKSTELLVWVDPTEGDMEIAKNSGAILDRCEKRRFRYAYFYSAKICCEGKYYCNWNDMLTTYKNFFGFNTCYFQIQSE